MTDWQKLAEPFDDSEVKQRPGAATWDHKQECQGARCRDTKDPNKHHQFSYVDARAVAERLDEVLTPEGWNFTCSVIPGTDVVKGVLTIGSAVREDHGYPNSERDEEPIKAATSDALKRCAVLFGIGRHLYEDNKTPAARRVHRQPTHASRPHMVDTDILDPGDEALDDLRAEPTVRADMVECPIHQTKWVGALGDLYHRKPEGGFCRHPENIRKAAR